MNAIVVSQCYQSLIGIHGLEIKILNKVLNINLNKYM